MTMQAEILIWKYKTAKANLHAQAANMENLQAVTEKVTSEIFDISRSVSQSKLDKVAEELAIYGEMLIDAMRGLADHRHITVITLLVIEGKKVGEAAAIMGYSKRSINNLKAEALRELNKVLEK